jgi:two-component system LytT family response regulator
MNKLNVLIVDDETLARNVIKKYLEGREDIVIAGECSDGFECLKFLQNNKADILFLDIQMPRINGFELLEVLQEKPHIIFTTAFDEYAIRAFEMNAVDYLLKPFPKDRFLSALEKCIGRIKSQTPANSGMTLMNDHNRSENIDRIVVRQGNKVIVIPIDSIFYIESAENYVNIHCEKTNYMKEKTMKYYESALPASSFIRLHRRFIANISSITSIEPYTKDSYVATMKNGDKISVSQEGYSRFRERLK